MKRVFQTKFGVPTGNCFNAAVASVLNLDEIPDVDPTLADMPWRAAWCDVFDKLGIKWQCLSWEPEYSNWDHHPKGLSIATLLLGPGVRHAVVALDGVLIHDVCPGSDLVSWPQERLRKIPIEAWNFFESLESGTGNDRGELGAIEDVVLNEYTKDEWKEIHLKLKPDTTDAEYDKSWDDFQSAKAEHQRKMKLQ